MQTERLQFLTRLPLLLNSSLDFPTVVSRALSELKRQIAVEAATLFLLEDAGSELTFWALEGGDASRLEGKKMPAGKGIVGWVIKNKRSQLVQDAVADDRFFGEIDKEGGFVTRNLICSPLVVGGSRVIGAIQVLNTVDEKKFSADDMEFIEQFANQLAVSVDNAKLYEALRIKNAQLEKLEHRKNEAMTVIVHEFRTPLAIIQASADLLASGMLQDKQQEADIADTLMKGSRRLTRLVEEIRNVAISSEKALLISQSKVNLSKLFEDVCEQFAAALEQRKLELSLKVEELAECVEADEVLLVIVLKNLLANAVRFTPDEGQIRLEAKRDSGFVEISITDTGIGIAPGEQQVIFEKFYEVADSMHHSSGTFEFKSGGLGLGLSTVEAILKAHGVGIEVKSELGKGSRFSFRLPAA